MSLPYMFFVGGMSAIVLGLPTFLVAASIYTATKPKSWSPERRPSTLRRPQVVQTQRPF